MSGYPLNIPSFSDPFLGSNERRDWLDYDDRRFRERERDRREDDYRRAWIVEGAPSTIHETGQWWSIDRFSPEVFQLNCPNDHMLWPSYAYSSYLDDQRQGGQSDLVSYPLGHLGGSRSDHGYNNWNDRNCNQNRDSYHNNNNNNNNNNNCNWSQGNRGGPSNQGPGILGAEPGNHAVPELLANPLQVPALGMTGGGLGSGLTAQLAQQQQQQQLMAMVQTQSLVAAMQAQANANAQAQVQSRAKQGMHSPMGLLPTQLIATKEEPQEEKEDGAVQDDEETEDLNSTKQDHQVSEKTKPARRSRTSHISKGRQSKKNIYKAGSTIAKRLMFYYGKPNDIQPQDSLKFATQYPLENGVPSKALEVGSALGWSTFQLAKIFHQVLGIDCSPKFIKAANKLKTDGKVAYTIRTKGSPKRKLAKVPPDIDRTRVSFRQGDACNLPNDLGQFGCVLAENVICCLQNDLNQFLDRLPSLVAPGGILVFASPKTAFDDLKRCLGHNFELIEDKPAEENTHHATIWKRRKSS